jgi:hypothetical protein
MRPISVMRARGTPVGGVGPTGWATVATLSPAGIDSGWAGTTMRQKIPSAILVAGSKMRITLGCGSGNVAHITAAYIQAKAASGDPYDFSTTPVQVLFAGSSTVSIPGLSTALSDDLVLAVSGSVDLIFSAQFASSPDTTLGATSSATGFANYYKNGSSDAATVNTSGYTTYNSNNCLLISKIEIYQP